MTNRISTLMRSFTRGWQQLSLVKQFAVACFVILAIGMLSMAAWVSSRIETAVVSNSALSAALLMDSFIAPLLAPLDADNTLSADSQRELSELFEETPLGEQVEAYKIWGPGGLVVYSSIEPLIGQKIEVTDTQAFAWKGTIKVEYNTFHDEEDVGERLINVPLMEIYSPIRNKTGKIIGVLEFYANAGQLQRDLFYARLYSWLLFGAAGLIMFAALSSIVLRGSMTIQNQKATLENRVRELVHLRRNLKRASRRSTELNERFLRKVGSDIHDGPAQLLALALLKMDELFPQDNSDKQHQQLVLGVKEPLQEALTEIRGLSAGLVLPGLEGDTVQEVLQKAVRNHERRTGASVNIDIDINARPIDLPHSLRICMYRFAQETLNNAFFHGETHKAEVKVSLVDGALCLRTEDKGRGFDFTKVRSTSEGLGLAGLRERIESIGGHFSLLSEINTGTVVQASFKLQV